MCVASALTVRCVLREGFPFRGRRRLRLEHCHMALSACSALGSARRGACALLLRLCIAGIAVAQAVLTPAARTASPAHAPRGWNPWNKFGCDVSEADVRAAADALVSTGLADAGYTHLNLDDCWCVHGTKGGTVGGGCLIVLRSTAS